MLELLVGSRDLVLEHGQLGDLGSHEFLPDLEVLAVGEELRDLSEAESGVLPHVDQTHAICGTRRIESPRVMLAGIPGIVVARRR